MSNVFVTGIGMISAIGRTLAENRHSLISGGCGMRSAIHVKTRLAHQLPTAEIPIDNRALAAGIPGKTSPNLTRTTLLALHAVEAAIRDAGLTPAQVGSFDTALVGATTVGGMCLMDELYRDVHRAQGGSAFLAAYEAASVCNELQSRYAINGIVDTVNTACSSSANALLYGARLIHAGLARRVIAGGADSLSKFTMNGFNALHILSPRPCCPFDMDRQGLNLGEGAAFLVLEHEEDLGGKKAYARLSGYGNSNDAFHPSSLSTAGEGPFLSMKEALDRAGLNAPEIGFINAHGTGTENNDEVESKAMIRLFGAPPPFASTKSNTGHTLGASGAMEAAYGILNLVHQEIYASLHFNRPIEGTGLRPVTSYKKIPLHHVMSNSFGFSGNCTSLIFSKA